MDIKSLYIRNFLTISSAQLELDNRGLLLIQGENHDDPSARSNGAGKSSIVDSLFWVLYGETARGVSGDDVINDTAGKDCHVSAIIEDGPDVYEISRGRKSKEIKNALIVKHQTPLGWSDLSKGTDKETQKAVDKIIGSSKEVFAAAVYAGQEKMPDLPGMTDKNLKALIEESAGVEILTEAYAEARKRALTAEAAEKVARSEKTNAEAALVAANDELTAAEAQKALFELQRKDRAKLELAKIPPINAQIIENTAKRGKLPDEAALEKRIAGCQSRLDAQKGEAKTLESHKAAAQAKERELAGKMALLSAGRAGLESREKALTEIESLVGKPCGECGKSYCEHDLETAKAARIKAIGEKKAELVPIAQAIRTLQGELKTLQATATTFEASMTDVSDVVREHTELSNALNEVRTLTRHSTTLGHQVNTIKEAATAHLKAENPWVKIEQDRRDKRQHVENRVKRAGDDLNTAVDACEVAATVVKVFGPAGVRAQILDTVTPLLNEQTSDYLGILADGNIHATWNTLAKNAKGELKEKFNIDVSNDKGAKSFAGLSGGEKRKARIASSMALQDMVATRATKPINLWIGDEIDHALDEAGLERLMTVLEKKARERGTVLVISHNSLSDWIDNVITVEKSGGVATVSGATERGL